MLKLQIEAKIRVQQVMFLMGPWGPTAECTQDVRNQVNMDSEESQELGTGEKLKAGLVAVPRICNQWQAECLRPEFLTLCK